MGSLSVKIADWLAQGLGNHSPLDPMTHNSIFGFDRPAIKTIERDMLMIQIYWGENIHIRHCEKTLIYGKYNDRLARMDHDLP